MQERLLEITAANLIIEDVWGSPSSVGLSSKDMWDFSCMLTQYSFLWWLLEQMGWGESEACPEQSSSLARRMLRTETQWVMQKVTPYRGVSLGAVVGWRFSLPSQKSPPCESQLYQQRVFRRQRSPMLVNIWSTPGRRMLEPEAALKITSSIELSVFCQHFHRWLPNIFTRPLDKNKIVSHK